MIHITATKCFPDTFLQSQLEIFTFTTIFTRTLECNNVQVLVGNERQNNGLQILCNILIATRVMLNPFRHHWAKSSAVEVLQWLSGSKFSKELEKDGERSSKLSSDIVTSFTALTTFRLVAFTIYRIVNIFSSKLNGWKVIVKFQVQGNLAESCGRHLDNVTNRIYIILPSGLIPSLKRDQQFK